jgi:hypothetical protein
MSALQIRFRLFGPSGGTWKGEGWDEGVRRIAGATHHPQDLYLFQVIVLPVRGMPLETVHSTTGRTDKHPKILFPLIKKEVKVVVFLLDIDYDNATS